MPVTIAATDGYISFSESSESEMFVASPAGAAGIGKNQLSSNGGNASRDDLHGSLAAGGGQDQPQQGPRDDGDGGDPEDGSEDDKWDFGDEESDRQQEHGGKSARGEGAGDAPDGSGGGVNVSGAAGEPPQARVTVDRLGRRENVPRR